MKLRNALMATALMSMAAFATESTTVDPSLAPEQPQPEKRLSGSLNAGYMTNYNGRGIVISHTVAEGDGAEFIALKYNYDFGKKSAWSLDGTIAYAIASSGHTMYGNPKFSPEGFKAAGQSTGQLQAAFDQYVGMQGAWNYASDAQKDAFMDGAYAQKVASGDTRIKQCNLENEFVVKTALKYTTEKFNVSFGHTFVHGGILGVMAKHYRNQGASVVNEFFIAPEWTPTRWLSAGCSFDYSCQGITGFWFEPYLRAKAPIIGTPEDVKLAGVLELAASFTQGYFEGYYGACTNGSQAYWVKLATPYFIKENLIFTPSVSFNWLGLGGVKANKRSHFKNYSGEHANVPFRNFGVVGTFALTYTF